MLDDKIKPQVLSDIAYRMVEYVTILRAQGSESRLLVDAICEKIDSAFREPHTNEQMAVVYLDFVDIFYCELMYVDIRDRFLESYVGVLLKLAFSYFTRFDGPFFFIVDNGIRDDKFKLVVELFRTAGFEVVHPYAVSQLHYSAEHTRLPVCPVAEVIEQIRQALAARKSILYIEKDESVDYIEEVLQLALDCPEEYMRGFRNAGTESDGSAVHFKSRSES